MNFQKIIYILEVMITVSMLLPLELLVEEFENNPRIYEIMPSLNRFQLIEYYSETRQATQFLTLLIDINWQ